MLAHSMLPITAGASRTRQHHRERQQGAESRTGRLTGGGGQHVAEAGVPGQAQHRIFVAARPHRHLCSESGSRTGSGFDTCPPLAAGSDCTCLSDSSCRSSTQPLSSACSLMPPAPAAWPSSSFSSSSCRCCPPLLPLPPPLLPLPPVPLHSLHHPAWPAAPLHQPGKRIPAGHGLGSSLPRQQRERNSASLPGAPAALHVQACRCWKHADAPRLNPHPRSIQGTPTVQAPAPTPLTTSMSHSSMPGSKLPTAAMLARSRCGRGVGGRRARAVHVLHLAK